MIFNWTSVVRMTLEHQIEECNSTECPSEEWHSTEH